MCSNRKPIHTVQHSKPIHYFEHSKRVGRAAELTHERTQNCAMTVQRTNSEMCYAPVLDFVELSGAQSRNRTSDTRIFNVDGYGLLFLFNGLNYGNICVLVSVFLTMNKQ
jgi:hypothetical protein